MDILGRIWELSDIDRDGFLDRDEFAVVSVIGLFELYNLFQHLICAL